MSLTTVSRDALDVRTSSAWRCRSWGRRPEATIRSVKPMMALSGVRISWLIAARKSVLAALARSAAALASARASPCARRSETSRKVATIVGSPAWASGIRRNTPSTQIQPRALFRARYSHVASTWPRDSMRVAA